MAENTIPGGLDLSALSKLPLTLELCKQIMAAIQNGIYQGRTINSFEPMQPPRKVVKQGGQYLVTEIPYGTRYMNSYLDILYPTADTGVKRPTVIYAHGGGFFGGSKTMGDPAAAGDDKNFRFEDIVSAGFNFVNVDYVLTPEGHFPDPLCQFVEAIDFCAEHAGEYGLDMENVVIFGSSAGAVLTMQFGALLTDETYRQHLGIFPKIDPKCIRCLIVDDAPTGPEKENASLQDNWAINVMNANYYNTMDLQSDAVRKTNPYLYLNAAFPPCFFDAGPKDGFPNEMRACRDRLAPLGVETELYIPQDPELPHGFLNLARENGEAAEGEKRLIDFMQRHTAL